MITLKLKLTQPINIEKYQKQFTNIRNFAFNRFIEGMSQNQIEQEVKNKLNNIELMDVSLQKEAVNDARTLIKKDQKTVIFGSKKNWQNYNNKVISKEEYKKRKLCSIIVRGETGRGNRKFKLDAKNNQIIFSPNRTNKIICQYEKTKRDKTLLKLQQLCELGTTYFTARLDENYVYITFDETILRKEKYKSIKKEFVQST
jgi:hypothetical protein